MKSQRISVVEKVKAKTDFDEIWYVGFLENLSIKFDFHENSTITGTLHEDFSIFMTISR